MFGIKHNECVGFEPRWTVKKVYHEGSTETPLYVNKDASSGTNESKNVKVQTDAPETTKNLDVNVDELAGFLNRVYSNLSTELGNSANSRAFDGYRLLGDSNDTTTKLIQTINVIPQSQPTKPVSTAKISSVTWNCSANTVAVSMSHSHQSWCYDPGFIMIYTLNRDDEFPSSPNKKISCESCVSEIQFHPLLPALLAGSTHAGEINLWNIKNNEDDVVVMKITRNENVSLLRWMLLNHVTLDVVFLVTASLDGIITMWRFNSSYTCANVHEKYKIKPPLMTRTLQKKTNRNQLSTDDGTGITCIDFSKQFPDMFIVGTEGGLVIQCSMSKPTKLKGGTEIDPLFNPVHQYYQKYETSVNTVQFSTTRKDVFLTNGVDNQARVYVIGQEDPARVIFFNTSTSPLYWVPNEQSFVFGYGNDGKIEVYDIVTGKILKKNKDKQEQLTVNSQSMCCLNPARSNLIAVVFRDGVMELWSVPWSSFCRNID